MGYGHMHHNKRASENWSASITLTLFVTLDCLPPERRCFHGFAPKTGSLDSSGPEHNPIDRAVSRDISAPLYEQVCKAVISLISSEGLVPGDILPSEHELCRYLGVSRTMVRQALGQLVNDDLVEWVRGKGTFVARPKTTEHLMSTLLGLYADVTQRGGEVVSDVLDHSTVPAEGDVAESPCGCQQETLSFA